MKESEARNILRTLKGDTLHMDIDQETGDVKHAEVHLEDKVVWTFPSKAKPRLRPSKWQQHGVNWKAFSLERRSDGYELESMGRHLEV